MSSRDLHRTLNTILAAGALVWASGMWTPSLCHSDSKHHVHSQHVRIRQGVQSGQLTMSEAQHIQTEKKRTQQMADSFKADGLVTAKEKCRLMKRQAETSRQIYNQKHDAQHR
jgi:hypothetical protein